MTCIKDFLFCFQGKELSKISCSEDFYNTVGPELIGTRVRGVSAVSAEEITSAPSVWLEKQLKEFQSEGDWQSCTSPLCGGLSDGAGAILFSIRAQKAFGWVHRGNTVRFFVAELGPTVSFSMRNTLQSLKERLYTQLLFYTDRVFGSCYF